MTTKKHEVPEELLAKLLADYKKPEDLIGENGLLKQLTKLLVEKALDAELTEHLGHDRLEPVVNTGGNTRNGKSRKTLRMAIICPTLTAEGSFSIAAILDCVTWSKLANPAWLMPLALRSDFRCKPRCCGKFNV
jgi:hypothetical protein